MVRGSSLSEPQNAENDSSDFVNSPQDGTFIISDGPSGSRVDFLMDPWLRKAYKLSPSTGQEKYGAGREEKIIRKQEGGQDI